MPIIFLFVVLLSYQAQATDATSARQDRGEEGMQIKSRYVKHRVTFEDEKPIPSNYYDVPDDRQPAEASDVSLDEVYPDDVNLIPDYDPHQ